MLRISMAFVSGFLFALGLGLAGMTRPSKVIGFLDVVTAWDPSLLFVMVGAVAVYAVGFRLIMRRKKPIAEAAFNLPSRGRVDRRLTFGAIIFGVGWGLGGYCPGPALVTAATGSASALTFFAAMLLGMLTYSWIEGRSRSKAPTTSRFSAAGAGEVKE